MPQVTSTPGVNQAEASVVVAPAVAEVGADDEHKKAGAAAVPYVQTEPGRSNDKGINPNRT